MFCWSSLADVLCCTTKNTRYILEHLYCYHRLILLILTKILSHFGFTLSDCGSLTLNSYSLMSFLRSWNLLCWPQMSWFMGVWPGQYPLSVLLIVQDIFKLLWELYHIWNLSLPVLFGQYFRCSQTSPYFVEVSKCPPSAFEQAL